MADTIHQVSFVDVKESYPFGSSIECRYIVKEPFVRSNRDWIGIYRVGWRSYDNYETYVWVQLPAANDDSEAADCEGNVTFPADSLPKDFRDFYQFCYVSSANQVCGVSAPFQLCTSMDDLIEVQDPDDPTTMVIKTRSQLLEEQVTALKKERLELLKETQLLHLELEAERSSKGQLMTELQRLAEQQDQLDLERNSSRLLNEQIKDLQDTLQAERRSNEQLHEQIRGMRDELATERKAREESPPQQLEVNLDQENQTTDAGIKAQTAADESDAITSSLGISCTDEGGDRAEASSVAAVAASAEDDAESKQMSFTERLTGSVLKHLKKASDWFAEDFEEDDQTQETERGHSVVNDKTEQSLRLCPVCNVDFLDVSEHEISAHIEGHNGLVCPICFMQFDKNYKESMVTAHVNSHLE